MSELEPFDEVVLDKSRVAELERHEAAVLALVADLEHDGSAMLSDIQRGDRFALVRRYRAIVRAKLDAQSNNS